MNIIDGKFKHQNDQDYYWAVIDKNRKKIRIFKNFSCLAHIMKHIEETEKLIRSSIINAYSFTFLGNKIDLYDVPKKYIKFEII